jgi:hypothetical protein
MCIYFCSDGEFFYGFIYVYNDFFPIKKLKKINKKFTTLRCFINEFEKKSSAPWKTITMSKVLELPC